MRKIFLIVTTILMVTFSAFAEEQMMVAVYQLDGQKTLFAFADEPEVTYTATDLVLTTSNTSVQYPIAQLKKIQFEMAEGIDEVFVDKRISFRDGSIVIEGGVPNSPVNIYSVLGVLTAQFRLDANGDAVIPTQGLSGQPYILSNGSITFKFIAQ